MGSGYQQGARTNCGAWRAEQFAHLGNYTLTPGKDHSPHSLTRAIVC